MASTICSGCILKSECERLYNKTQITDCYFFPNKNGFKNYKLKAATSSSASIR